MKKLIKQSIEMLEPIKARLDAFDGDADIDDLRKEIDSLLNLFRNYQERNGGTKKDRNNGLKLLALVIKLFTDFDDLF